MGLPHLQHSTVAPPVVESMLDLDSGLREEEGLRHQGVTQKRGHRMTSP